MDLTANERRADRVVVDGVGFDEVTMRDAVAWIVAMARRRDRPRHVCTGNLDHLVLASRDPAFREIYARADLVLADGAPIVWLSRAGPRRLPERVAGSDLLGELVRASSETGLRLFFLGGRPGAAARAAARARALHPRAAICGTYCPPPGTFSTADEQARIRRRIAAARPEVLLVGLGAPKQEKWIAANQHVLGVPVSIGVGASFDMASGLVRRAPPWMRAAGLEWLHRLAHEPARLFHRYVVDDLPYLAAAALRASRARAVAVLERGADRPRVGTRVVSIA